MQSFTLDSEPVHQNTGKPVIGTTLVIRLILDRAATTEEAVELLNQYDMFATSGRDYHFYITDASGDGRVVEYDCESETREMVATPIVPSRISLDSIRIKSFRIRRMAFTVMEKSGMTKWKLFLTMRKLQQ